MRRNVTALRSIGQTFSVPSVSRVGEKVVNTLAGLDISMPGYELDLQKAKRFIQ
jgi:hypothetical protein